MNCPSCAGGFNLWQNKILRAFAVVFVLLVLIGGSVLSFGYRQHRAKLVPPYLVLLDPRQNPFLFLGGKIARSSLITNARRHDLDERIPTHPRQDVAGATLAYQPNPKSLEKHPLGVLLAPRIGREQIKTQGPSCSYIQIII